MPRSARSYAAAVADAHDDHHHATDAKVPICALPPVPDRALPPDINPLRASLILLNARKWVNGTHLHYHFLDQPAPAAWVGAPAQREVVRRAFKAWKDLGIGLEFSEVANRADAEIRVGFDQSDGSWSYVGRDVVDQAPDPSERTMNFGWDLTTPYGWVTALHEIGHTLGLPHEHQNPKAGIVWNEQAVLDYFRGPPNNWTDSMIQWNILRKLNVTEVIGSTWDPASVMEYAFPAGLIEQPVAFQAGVPVATGLSPVDVTEIRGFYPALTPAMDPELVPFQSRQLILAPGQQANFRIKPAMSRKYVMQTFGTSDSVMVLFEKRNGELEYLAGDDDGGQDRNARIQFRLDRNKEYVLRLRLYFAEMAGEMAVMMT
jgi:hypothetical protein